MIVQLWESEFILIGTLCRFTFRLIGVNAGKAWQYLKVEEGKYENGKFKLLRIRNGGERKTVAIPMAAQSLAYWDVSKNDWQVERDSIEIRLGASSADIRLQQTLSVK